MPIDFAPPQPNAQPFNIAPVQYADPLQTLAQMGQLRTQALQQQQAQLGITQAQLQLKSNQAMMDAFVKGDGDYDKTDQAMRETPGILPNDYLAFQQHATTIATNRAALEKDKLAIQDHNNEQWSNILNPEGGINSQDELNAAIQTGASRGLKVPPELTTPQGGVIPFTDAAHVKGLALSLLLPAQISKQKLEAAQAGEATARGQQATAEQQKLAAETDILQQKQRLYKIFSGAPQALNEWVNSSIDPVKFPAANAAAKNEMRYAGDLDKMTEILQKYSASPVSAELEKVQVPTKVEQARQTEQATAPIKTGEAVATTLGTEKAKAGMLPAPWSTLDPQTGREGLNKSIALDQKYTDTMAKAQNTLDTIGAALKGNQRAASFITIEQLKSQLNRVTNTEIAATNAGASLIRNIQNDISQKFQGRPYSETLKDSIALANLEKTAAENEYAGGQTALSNNYKIGPLPHAVLPRGVSPAPGARNAPPVPTSIPEPYRRTAQYSASRQQWRYTTDGGKTWQTVQANK